MYFDRFPDRAPDRAHTEDELAVALPVPGKRSLSDPFAVPRLAHLTAGALAPGKRSRSEDLPVQRFEDAPAEADQIHAAAARGTATPSVALPFLERIQQLFGRHDISGIQAHAGADAAAAAAAMGARAYATGSHVVLGGRADLFTVAHEAAHIVQQRGGVQLRDGVGSRGDRYERHADQVAERVVAGQSAEALLDQVAAPATDAGPRASHAVQRAPDYRSEEDLGKLTLIAFDRYAHTQADWAVSDEIREQKAALRALLAFARQNKGVVLGSCRGYHVSALLARRVGQGGEVDLDVMAYSRAASPEHNADSIKIEAPAGKLKELIALGHAIRRLEAAIDKTVLATCIVEQYDAPLLTQLVEAKAVDDFIAYYKNHRPQLPASNGKEILAFLAFREHGLKKIDTYKTVLPEIRNYHRFAFEVLEQLCAHRAQAESGQSRLPICVILQTSVDTSGAFAINPNLLAVIERSTHLVLVAEGRDSVPDFAKDLTKFAAFSSSKQIDELLLSAHGGTTQLKLAGKVGLTSDAKKQNGVKITKQFFTRLARLLRSDPSARLVLNGCLTNASNVPELALASDPDEAAQQILKAMAAAPNLTSLVHAVMGGHHAQIRGANASFPPAKVGLLDDGRGLDLNATEDPALTSPDKLTYVEHGTEPKGVLRATLEAWATDRDATITALTRRAERTAADRSWPETVIRAVTLPILKDPGNASLIQTMGTCADVLAKLRFQSSCRVARLADQALPPFVADFFPLLSKSELWATDEYDFIPLVVLQVWLTIDRSKAGELLQLLARRFSLQNATALVDLDHLAPFLDDLLAPPQPDVAPPGGPLLIALLYLSRKQANAPAQAKRYVETLVGASRVFPPGCGRMLKGANERRLLKYAGVLGDEQAMAAPNVAPAYGGENEIRVRSVTRRCTANHEVPLYALPSGERVGEMGAGVEMHVIGELTWTCDAAAESEDVESEHMETENLETENLETENLETDDPPPEPGLREGRQPGDQVALLAIELGGPFPTVFIEQAAVVVR